MKKKMKNEMKDVHHLLHCMRIARQNINTIITHSERALFDLNARVEARGIIVPKAVGRGYYNPERRHFRHLN